MLIQLHPSSISTNQSINYRLNIPLTKYGIMLHPSQFPYDQSIGLKSRSSFFVIYYVREIILAYLFFQLKRENKKGILKL